MQQFTTPMMKQYEKIKKEYQDCLLFYRMGDFYELFMEDAYIGAQVLNITLTSRPKGKDGRIPMAGVPYHAVDSYLAKLVKSGYKVAICEQVSLPNKYGIIDREVVRVVTPGTVLDEKALDKKENNYIVSIVVLDKTLAIASADLSTGYFSVLEIEFENLSQVLKDELARLSPSECIMPDELYNDAEFLRLLKSQKGLNIFPFHEWDSYAHDASSFLKKHFDVATLSGFGIDENALALETAAALLGYLKSTQKSSVSHIKKITTASSLEYMSLDRSTMINLELFSTIRDHDVRGSLLSVLDITKTAMGGRLLKLWIRKPLVKKELIVLRLDAVEEFVNHERLRQDLQKMLETVNDIERLTARLSVNIGNARDLVNLKVSLKNVLEIKAKLREVKTPLIETIDAGISKKIQQVIDCVETTIVDEPPIELKGGGLIRHGVDETLDSLRAIVSGSKQWIFKFEKRERERTGIGSLKVRFNKIFGFYIEVSKANLHLVPENYIRKQTLVNGERFITPKLKEHEELILTAEEKINTIEYTLYQKVLTGVLSYIDVIQQGAASIAELDCLINFASIAQKENYVRPKILYSGEIKISQGRHPVVEKMLDAGNQFVPNDVALNNLDRQLLLITGPNMAGKSVFIRQVALIVLMAQIGSFVPASQAYLSVVDRIFVRSGASDVITCGLSTFMVEMVETAHILNHATSKSLIVMDEIGRGTSTYDGISLAWAIAQYLVENQEVAAKTLFATHYHELQALEETHPEKIKNYHMAVLEDKGDPVFLHTILPGGASHSFGIAVAKLAGVPKPVIEQAFEKLTTLNKRSTEPPLLEEMPYQSPISLAEHLIQKELEELDIYNLTPLEAINILADLKDKLTLLKDRDESLSEVD